MNYVPSGGYLKRVITPKGSICGVKCPASSNGESVYIAHETECGKFYECSSSSPILFQCPAGLYFDQSANACNWNVDCGSLVTSTVVASATEASVQN
ncbi:hypothetical protein NQ318_006220 [Aromia moschata]|uniref:Chitin-binding type-2 domain-containing protein n=1 Tax=Aromia moschata TaxID=1265417 RepID=A0AAV8XVX2_9CUCU|nr:hypothetical protein NQ318_006220 [Aromia moschata]